MVRSQQTEQKDMPQKWGEGNPNKVSKTEKECAKEKKEEVDDVIERQKTGRGTTTGT